jgi:hypothetical protein
MSEPITENLLYLIENAPTAEYAVKLKEVIKHYKLQTTKIEKTKQINLDIKEKIRTTFDFINFIKTICKSSYPSIFGSFPRMLFERCFSGLSELDGYGNTINHDIDIYIYEEINNFNFNQSDFKTLINVLNLIKSNMTFGDYKIHSIHDKTITSLSRVLDNAKDRMLDIPHYVIILKNGDKIIKYDLLAYKIEPTHTWTNEFDINSLSISRRGIHCDQTFFDTIINIMNNTADCTIDFKKFIAPLYKPGYRLDKVKIFNDILYFCCMRTKILSIGYKQIFNDTFGIIELSIEKDNDCPITSLKPPYIQMELECGHKCSLMTLAGIINIRASNDTESILCPFCRHTMIPKISITKNLNKLKKFDVIEDNIPLQSLPPHEIGNEIITKENKDYVTGLMYGFTPQQIMSGRYPVSDYDLLNN